MVARRATQRLLVASDWLSEHANPCWYAAFGNTSAARHLLLPARACCSLHYWCLHWQRLAAANLEKLGTGCLLPCFGAGHW